MGVCISLDVDPIGMEPAAWEAAFDETLRLLSAWQPALMGLGHREIATVRVAQYTSSIVRRDADAEDISWCIVGDRESLHTGESHRLFRSLGRGVARSSRSWETDRGALRETPRDILVPLARDADGRASFVSLLSGKTQGQPYHYALLAAAMVVEDRFPAAAVVSGDIDRAQAEEARRMAEPILGRQLALPVRVDVARLMARLGEHFAGRELAEAFQKLLAPGGYEATEVMLRTCPTDAAAEVWKRELCQLGVNTVGVVRLLISWFNAGRDLAAACRIACQATDGPRFEPEALVETMASTWIAVSPSAREVFAPFRRSEGRPPTVWTQLGEFFFDATSAGRHMNARIEPAAALAALVEVFGQDRGLSLCQRLTDKSAKIEADLVARAAPVQDLVSRAFAQADDDTELLVGVSDPAALGPEQRRYVEALASAAARTLVALRDSDTARIICESAEKAKGVIAWLSSEHGPTLTEDTWDRILALDDVDELSFCCALLLGSSNEIHIAQTRRALLENRPLLQYAMAIARDPRRTSEIVAERGSSPRS
jgi:hypothetical protein